MKAMWKVVDVLFWISVGTILVKLDLLNMIVGFLLIVNLFYYIGQCFLDKRLNWFYEYSVKGDKVFIHFSPKVLFGFWINSKQLLQYRKHALEELKKKGVHTVYGDTISLTTINNKLPVETKLDKWSREGILTIISTLFVSYGNIQNVLKLSLARKTVNVLCKYPYMRFKYA
ncbi:hypothetical protein ACE41H_15340 [Paenibacillus enshidis]|uniref:Uncharacterized protein n=1 Tax=Paenibacillus enshidis TaxID=1458439 RepID=A0ABV5AVA7_9BACL